jgi:translation initiation factor IF-3
MALRQPKEDEHRTNEGIRVPRVRLVADGAEPRVLSTKEALEIARADGLDLVEIAPNADPPVVKIIDYSKFKYEQKKKQKELKAKAHKVVVKEIRFGPNTDEHDFDFKVKHAQNFLKTGCKVKAYVHFQGRTIVFKERGEILLLKFAQALEDVAKVEDLPKLEGKRMILMLSPKTVSTGGTTGGSKPAPPAAPASK